MEAAPKVNNMLTKENGFTLPLKWKFPDAGKYFFTFLALFITLLAIYSNSFYGDWHYDDFANIVSNPYIQMKSFSWEEIKHCIYGLQQKRPSRPLAYLSFALNYQLDGLNVFGFHVFNFIIHYLAAVFLFLFIYKTLKLPLLKDQYAPIAYPVALLATFFWAINPVLVTSVTYIVQRMASMAAMFYIMAMFFYLQARTAADSRRAVIYCILCAILGLGGVLSKENAAMLPVSILLFDLFLIQGISKDGIKKFIKIIILPIIVIGLIGLIYTGGFSNAIGDYDKLRDFTMMERVLTQPRVILFYLSLLFYPILSRLTLLYDIEASRSLLQPLFTIPAILIILSAIGFALYISRKRPLLSFCIIFYFLNHLIEGSIFNLELIYEHRNYLPAMLLFVPVAEFILYFINYFSYKKAVQLIVASGIIIIIVGQGDITYRRNNIISSELLLWMDNIEKYPNLSRTYSNLGNELMLYKQNAKGLYNYEKAMALDNFANSDSRALQEYNLGIYYYREGKYDLALPYFEKAYKALSSYQPNTIFIAKIYLLRNEYLRARHLIEPLIKKYPANPELNEIFCLILFRENNFSEAELYAKKFLKNNLSSTFPLLALAEIARKKGNFQSAILLWKLYRQSFPSSAYANLALIELSAQIDDKKMFDEELAKLLCLKKTAPLNSYLEENSRNKNLLFYIPDADKIKEIFKERNKACGVADRK